MGIPIIPPPVVSGTCNRCEPLRWPVGESPRFIHIEFEDLVKCPLCPVNPPNAEFIFDTLGQIVCRWVFEDANWIGVFELPLGSSIVVMDGKGPGAGWHFFAEFAGPCDEDFTNAIVACGGNNGSINGTAHVIWS